MPTGEVRNSIAVVDTRPRMLLAGPARLLHVQVEKRKGSVTLYRAQRRLGTDADCQAGAIGDVAAIAPHIAALDVGSHEVVCAKVDRKARVSWHAMPKSDMLLAGQPFASATLP